MPKKFSKESGFQPLRCALAANPVAEAETSSASRHDLKLGLSHLAKNYCTASVTEVIPVIGAPPPVVALMLIV